MRETGNTVLYVESLKSSYGGIDRRHMSASIRKDAVVVVIEVIEVVTRYCCVVVLTREHREYVVLEYSIVSDNYVSTNHPNYLQLTFQHHSHKVRSTH